MMKRVILVTSIVLTLVSMTAEGQVDTTFTRLDLTFNEYLHRVSTGNLEYAAGRFNVSIAEAKIEASRVFPNPYVSFDWLENRESSQRSGYEYSTEIGTTIELGGKRRARIDLAQNEYELSIALLEDYFRNLRAEAALGYLDCLKHKQLYEVVFNSWQTMKKLSEADSIRFKLGSIMEIDAIQSKVEAGILFNELILAATEWENVLVELTVMTGQTNSDTLFVPSGQSVDTCRLFSLDYLTEQALSNRSDLLAALKNREVSRKSLDLVRSERVTDIDLNLNLSNARMADGIAPATKGVTGGILLPIKFSNLNKGEIKMSQDRIGQSEKYYQQVQLQIKSELLQAWNLYYVYCRQVDNFENGLLRSASGVMNGKIYSYKRGENSLLEVLNAQRTYNDVQTAYYEALYNRAAALVNLEKSAGIWDIDF